LILGMGNTPSLYVLNDLIMKKCCIVRNCQPDDWNATNHNERGRGELKS